jgi:hypothetical protein
MTAGRTLVCYVAAAMVSPAEGGLIAIDLLGSIWVLKERGGEARKLTPDLVRNSRSHTVFTPSE